jgi:hypothetical protein
MRELTGETMKDQRGEEINNEPKNNNDQNPLAVFLIFLRLGLTSFGSPSAHPRIFQRGVRVTPQLVV